MFTLVKIINGRINVPEPEYLNAPASVTVTEGMALTLSGGLLAKASGKPTHIALKKQTVGSEELPVMRVEKNMVFAVKYSNAGNAVVGSKLAMGTDGVSLGAASDSGIATVVYTNGVDLIHVIFE